MRLLSQGDDALPLPFHLFPLLKNLQLLLNLRFPAELLEKLFFLKFILFPVGE
jgi:hypothetical protein